MTKKPKAPVQSRMRRELLETAKGLHTHGVMDDETYGMITTRLAPNRRTIAAMQAARRGEVVTVGSIDALFKNLNADD